MAESESEDLTSDDDTKRKFREALERKHAKAAGGGGRFDLDVPAFLRRKGGDGSNE